MAKTKVSDAKVLSLLAKGKTPAQIAKKYRISEPALVPRIRKFRENGLVVRSETWPFSYHVRTPEERASLSVPMQHIGLKEGTVNDPDRILEAHKCGEWFKIVSGKVSGGKIWALASGTFVHCFKEREFTIKAFAQKLVIYPKKWHGFSPAQQIVEARTRARKRAEAFAIEHGLVLDWAGYAENPEFATTQMRAGVTKELRDGMGLKEAPFRSDGVTFKAGTSSHPGKVHLSFSSDYSPSACKDYAQRIHVVGASSRVVDCPERLDKHEEVLKEINGVLGKITSLLGDEKQPEVVQAEGKKEWRDRREVG